MPSTLPPASEIKTPLEIGSTAIGQFKTLATPLQLASVAQVIAADGVRYLPTLAAGEGGRGTRVTSKQVADTISSLMVDVVGYGTGTLSAIGGVKVAGKTGTAELEDTRGPDAEASDPEQHGRLVHGVRAGGAPADRRRRDVRARRRRRLDGRARREGRARGRV